MIVNPFYLIEAFKCILCEPQDLVAELQAKLQSARDQRAAAKSGQGAPDFCRPASRPNAGLKGRQ